jgi:DNA processing protein
VVGTREASDAGRLRGERLARELADFGIVIVSGLARGVDTAALSSAIKIGSKTIAVIGTPLSKAYSAENFALSGKITS